MAARRSKKHEEHEEHPDERWLVTYADMITLLMVLFIVLYAISQVDLAKFDKFKAGFKDSGQAESGQLDGGEGLLDDNGNPKPEVVKKAIDALNNEDKAAKAAADEQAAFQVVSDDLNNKLAAAGLEATVGTRIESRGLIITILTDQVLFAPGSDVLTAEGSAIVDKLAVVLGQMDNDVSVEGHTDNLPINTTKFQSNWELSTARATSVLRSLVEQHGIDPHRMSAAGYADTKPVASNDSPEGRSANRRVEIVIHTKLTPPGPDAAAGDTTTSDASDTGASDATDSTSDGEQ